MITGQILIYRYNNLLTTREGNETNRYTLQDVTSPNAESFRQAIEDSLDTIPAGGGYSLVKWDNRFFQCEKDVNNPDVPYVRSEISYHPLFEKFTI